MKMHRNEEQDRRPGARTPDGLAVERQLLRKRRTWRLLLAIEVVMLAGVTALAFQTAGCGRHGDAGAPDGVAGQDAVSAVQSGGADAGGAVAAATSPSPPAPEPLVPAVSDTLPPELEVLAAEQVRPGEVVEITAESSDDVVAMTLADGRGRPQPMAYDRATGQWHVFYRVPMRIRGERLALSVTAKNGAERWRRVWIFMTPVEGGTAEPDTVVEK